MEKKWKPSREGLSVCLECEWLRMARRPAWSACSNSSRQQHAQTFGFQLSKVKHIHSRKVKATGRFENFHGLKTSPLVKWVQICKFKHMPYQVIQTKGCSWRSLRNHEKEPAGGMMVKALDSHIIYIKSCLIHVFLNNSAATLLSKSPLYPYKLTWYCHKTSSFLSFSFMKSKESLIQNISEEFISPFL